jgi:hypothetical protein
VKVKLALGSKRQAMLLGSLALVLVLAVVRWKPGSAAPSPPMSSAASNPATAPGGRAASAEDEPSAPAAPRGGRRASTKELSPDEIPVIHKEDFNPPRSGVGADGGRDLFDLRDPTRPPPPTPTPRPPAPGEGAFVGPLPPPPPTPTPKPPDVTFKFLGSFGPKENPIAVIQQGDEIFNARSGDTLFGKFVLRKVGYESIDVGFVGFAQTESKRLPISQ